jgi:hypothetical protein
VAALSNRDVPMLPARGGLRSARYRRRSLLMIGCPESPGGATPALLVGSAATHFQFATSGRLDGRS